MSKTLLIIQRPEPKFWLSILIFLAPGVSIFGCGGAKEQSSRPDFTVGAGGRNGDTIFGYPGHEDLVRMGLILFAAKSTTSAIGSISVNDGYIVSIQNADGSTTRFDDKLNTSGFLSLDPMVQGVFQSDKPDSFADTSTTPRLREYMLQNFAIPVAQDWHLGPDRQVFHFLRNRIGGAPDKLDTALNTCSTATSRIATATQTAVDFLNPKSASYSPVNALFMMGHAMHIIQDSFSEAHTKRELPLLKKIEDICYYGPEIATTACRHDDSITGPDLGPGGNDWIWDTPNGQSPDSSPSGLGKLKPDARIAAFTTAGYIMAFQDIVLKNLDVKKSMSLYFTGSYDSSIVPVSFQGFLDCSQIDPST